jgi:hypothetical protein
MVAVVVVTAAAERDDFLVDFFFFFFRFVGSVDSVLVPVLLSWSW